MIFITASTSVHRRRPTDRIVALTPLAPPATLGSLLRTPPPADVPAQSLFPGKPFRRRMVQVRAAPNPRRQFGSSRNGMTVGRFVSELDYCDYAFLRRVKPSPARPRATRASEAGSGTLRLSNANLNGPSSGEPATGVRVNPATDAPAYLN